MFHRGRSAVVCCAIAYAGSAFAAPVTQVANISTGVDRSTGLQLASRAVDPNYTIAIGGTGGFGQAQMITVTDNFPAIWQPDAASTASRWIGINSGSGSMGIFVPGGTFLIQTTVDLTGYDPATASIAAGQYAVDDAFTGVQINGVTVYTPRPAARRSTTGTSWPCRPTWGWGTSTTGSTQSRST